MEMKKFVSMIAILLVLSTSTFAQNGYSLQIGAVSADGSTGLVGGMGGFWGKPSDAVVGVGYINYANTSEIGWFGVDGDLWIFPAGERWYGLVGANAQAFRVKEEETGDWQYGFNVGSGYLMTSWAAIELKYSRIRDINAIKFHIIAVMWE
jgi:hypothetical protein